MNKTRAYISILFIVLLVAGPWLEATEIQMPAIDNYCSCCQGPCHGCCCAKKETPTSDSNASDAAGCQCQMSSLPALPPIKAETNVNPVTSQQVKIYAKATLDSETIPDFGNHHIISENSAPPGLSRPAYVIYSSLLI